MNRTLTLQGRVGSSDVSEVHLGAGEQGTELAVKLFLARASNDTGLVEKLERFGRRAVAVQHPGLVAPIALGMLEGRLCQVAPYVEGPSFAQILGRLATREVVLPPPTAIYLLVELCSALGAAHGRGLAHGGISPHNVFLATDGRVRVNDLGVRLACDLSGSLGSVAERGKRGYHAPELVAGKDLPDPISDVYAIGALAYELLCGRALPAAASRGLSTRREEVMPPSRIDRRIPARLDPVILRAADPTRGRRFRTAGDLERALREVLSTAGFAPSATEAKRFLGELFPNEVVFGKTTAPSPYPGPVTLRIFDEGLGSEDSTLTPTAFDPRDDVPVDGPTQLQQRPQRPDFGARAEQRLEGTPTDAPADAPTLHGEPVPAESSAVRRAAQAAAELPATAVPDLPPPVEPEPSSPGEELDDERTGPGPAPPAAARGSSRVAAGALDEAEDTPPPAPPEALEPTPSASDAWMLPGTPAHEARGPAGRGEEERPGSRGVQRPRAVDEPEAGPPADEDSWRPAPAAPQPLVPRRSFSAVFARVVVLSMVVTVAFFGLWLWRTGNLARLVADAGGAAGVGAAPGPGGAAPLPAGPARPGSPTDFSDPNAGEQPGRPKITVGPPAAAKSALLTLKTDRPVRVLIDGVDTGMTTPLVMFPLEPGEHLVRLEEVPKGKKKPRSKKTRELVITLAEGKETVVNEKSP